MVRVKICGLTRRQDIIDAVKAGADALGFVFSDRSKRVIGAGEAEKLVPAVVATMPTLPRLVVIKRAARADQYVLP